MSVKTKKYVGTEGEEIRGIRVTERNFINVAKWCEGVSACKVARNGAESDHRVRVNTPHGIRAARVGDLVFRNGDKEFWIAKQTEDAKVFNFNSRENKDVYTLA